VLCLSAQFRLGADEMPHAVVIMAHA